MTFLLITSSKGISNTICKEEADESALRHAVKLLQENGELTEDGFVIRRNDNKPTAMKLDEFFEIPSCKTEVTVLYVIE